MTRDLQRATKRNPREVERILTGLIDGTMTVPVAEKVSNDVRFVSTSQSRFDQLSLTAQPQFGE